MIEFILLIMVACIWIWGIRCVFSEGYIFELAGDWIYKTFPSWVYKPTIGCTACMSSVHGTLWYWTAGMLFLPVTGFITTIIVWILFCICLCGVNFILLESIYKEE